MPLLLRNDARGLIRWRMVVCVVGGACVVFLAALLYGYWVRSGAGPARYDAGGSSVATPATTPAGPTDVVAEPLAGTGLEMLRVGAEEIIAPPDAVMCYAIRKKMADSSADIITYTVKAKITDVEQFYSNRLTRDGYKLLQRKPAMQPGGVLLVFLRESQRYSVTLRYTDKETVKIILVVAGNDQ